MEYLIGFIGIQILVASELAINPSKKFDVLISFTTGVVIFVLLTIIGFFI